MKGKQKIIHPPTGTSFGKGRYSFLISTILIILAFFLGIFFERTQNNGIIEKLENKKYYINLEQLKTKLKIQNSNPNIIIKLNGEEFEGERVLEIGR